MKKLGVREMTYKIIFVACAVTHTDRRTGIKMCECLLFVVVYIVII